MTDIVPIFVFANENRLLAFKFEEGEDEFEKAFNNWQDPEYLEDFFEKNKTDLQTGFFGTLTIEQAIQKTIQESENFENELYDLCHDNEQNLNNLIFKPLNNNETKLQLQQSKAYASSNKSWLRLYAIRLGPSIFLVTGSAIKLTKNMDERQHTVNELKKLKAAATYLKNQGIVSEDDYGFLEITD